MLTLDSGLVFNFPDAWESFTEGNRYVLHTPQGEEIIISAYRVAAPDGVSDISKPLSQLFENGLASARRAAAAPGLHITKALAEDREVCTLRCATVRAEGSGPNVFFGQAVIQYSRGVLLLTYEAPFIEGAKDVFDGLLKMIHER